MQCKRAGLTKYANVSAYIPTYTDLASPGAYPDLVSPPMFVQNLFVKNKIKEFKTVLMASFILLLMTQRKSYQRYILMSRQQQKETFEPSPFDKTLWKAVSAPGIKVS